MPSSIDILTLRDRVETALSAELGTYVYQNAATTPAVKVESGIIARTAQPQRVNGLEVVIEPYTAPSLQTLLSSHAFVDDQYRILLKQWDLTKSVATAVRTLSLALQDCLTGIEPLLPRNTAIDSLEQQALLIQYRRF